MRYEWTSTRLVTGNVATSAAAGLTHAALEKAGIDGTAKVFEIRLKDYRAVKARAVSKIQRLVMFGPMLGDPGYLRVGLGGRSPEQMRALLLEAWPARPSATASPSPAKTLGSRRRRCQVIRARSAASTRSSAIHAVLE